MKLKHPKKEINRLIDNDLNKEEKNPLLQHLQKCPKCKNEYQTLLFLKSMLSLKEKAEPSEYFIPRMLANLKAEESSVSLVDVIAKRARSLIVAFSGVIIVALGIFVYSGIRAPSELSYSESYENFLLAENGTAVTESSDTIEISYDDLWESIVIEE